MATASAKAAAALLQRKSCSGKRVLAIVPPAMQRSRNTIPENQNKLHSEMGFTAGIVVSIKSQISTDNTFDNATSSRSVTKRSPFSIRRMK